MDQHKYWNRQMSPADFVNPLTRSLPLAPPWGWYLWFRAKWLVNYWMDCYEAWCRCLCIACDDTLSLTVIWNFQRVRAPWKFIKFGTCAKNNSISDVGFSHGLGKNSQGHAIQHFNKVSPSFVSLVLVQRNGVSFSLTLHAVCMYAVNFTVVIVTLIHCPICPNIE